MNIRTIANPMTAIDSVKGEIVRDVKTDVSSEDRDANGQRKEDEPSKDPLSEHELKKAHEYLENLTGLKTNGLTLEIEQSGNYKIFLIKDATGQVVRRIVEWELRALIADKDKPTGQIFDKAA
jgi:uncharacterized FlaG/YvyC family protein